MNEQRKRIPFKLIFGIAGMLVVLAFSMALTTTTFAQTATSTPTATETLAPTSAPSDTPAATATSSAGQSVTPSSTPAPGGASSSATPAPGATATQAPSGTSGSGTGTVPVTGANTAKSAAVSNEINRLLNASDASLERMYNDLLNQVKSLMHKAKDVNDRDDRHDRDNRQSNSNGSNSNMDKNGKGSEMREDTGAVFANSALSSAQALLNSAAAGFNADGKIINRQVAINTLARIQVEVRRARSWINGSDTDDSGRTKENVGNNK